jgi:hypothetical protein
MATNIVRQNTGFIRAESQRASEDLVRAKEFRAVGNDRQAKAFETRAQTHIERVGKAANTIMKRTETK